uniref:Uncharacterized protein n=1 Tax=Rhizophora mucronata TaxID=61149 RepID=A0A2P2PRR3_RHIMU
MGRAKHDCFYLEVQIFHTVLIWTRAAWPLKGIMKN